MTMYTAHGLIYNVGAVRHFWQEVDCHNFSALCDP